MEEEVKKTGVEIVQVATATAPAYKLPDGTVVTPEEFIAWIGQMIYEIKKAVA